MNTITVTAPWALAEGAAGVPVAPSLQPGQIAWVKADSAFRLGGRGERPFQLHGLGSEALRAAREVPGVTARRDGVVIMAWDAAHALAHRFGIPPPPIPPPTGGLSAEGKENYKRWFGEIARPYQKERAGYLTARAYALLSLPTRTGKSLTSLMAATAAATKIGVILSPATVVPVWRRELKKRIPTATVVELRERGADTVRVECAACNGTGTGCKKCRRKGRVYAGRSAVESVLELATASAPIYIVGSYDVMLPHRVGDEAGKMHIVEDLPGWSGALKSWPLDVAILDESHIFRGWERGENRATSKRIWTKDGLSNCKRVWALTATPIYSTVANLWPQLDLISHGLYGDPPFAFHRSYCGGGKVSIGTGGGGSIEAWRADGVGPYVEELKTRLPEVISKATRADLGVQLPPILRQVIDIDPPEDVPPMLTDLSKPEKSLKAALEYKVPVLVENVVQEALEGGKVIIWCYYRESAEIVARKLRSLLTRGEHAKALTERGSQIWLSHGEFAADVRESLAHQFTQHQGPGFFVATIKAVEVGVSLRGATSAHFVELCYEPSAISQAEARPREVDSPVALSVLFYRVLRSVDGALVDVTVEKIEKSEQVLHDADGAELAEAFGTRQETYDEVARRLTAHLGADEFTMPEFEG